MQPLSLTLLILSRFMPTKLCDVKAFSILMPVVFGLVATAPADALPDIIFVGNGRGNGRGDEVQEDVGSPPTRDGPTDEILEDVGSPPTCGFGPNRGIPDLGGTVLMDFGPGHDRIRGVVVQPWDQRIVVVGESDGDFALARYNVDGFLDESFGIGGKMTTDFGGQRDVANAVVLQPDRKIVVVGTVKVGSNTDMGVARYLTDGVPDFSFSSDGRKAIGFGHDDEANAVALQPDGKIVVVGMVDERDGLVLGKTFRDNNPAIVRLHSNGAFDDTFDGDGKLHKESSRSSSFEAVAILDDRRILAGGSGAIYRFHSDGRDDTSFDRDGNLSVGDGVLLDLAAHEDGHFGYIVFTGGQYALSGLTPDGRYQFTTLLPFLPRALAVQADGKYVIAAAAGTSAIPGDFAVMRYTSAGAPDTTFGGNGLVSCCLVKAFSKRFLPDATTARPSQISSSTLGKCVRPHFRPRTVRADVASPQRLAAVWILRYV
jgi:uncharacterized delta-60 repeat protein